jgi:hypothetical protein
MQTPKGSQRAKRTNYVSKSPLLTISILKKEREKNLKA